MRYVIKGRWTENDVVYVSVFSPSFGFTDDLAKAFHFPSVGLAVDAIVARQKDIDLNGRYSSNDKFTIVGVREASQPVYVEVAL